MFEWEEGAIQLPLKPLPLRFVRIDPVVVILALELRSGFFIDAECCVWVHLQDGRWVDGLDGAFDGFCDDWGFVVSEGEEDILSSIHDGADTHGDAVDGDFVEVVVEETRVIFAGLLGEGFDTGA